jgi:hypothetical protein
VLAHQLPDAMELQVGEHVVVRTGDRESLVSPAYDLKFASVRSLGARTEIDARGDQRFMSSSITILSSTDVRPLTQAASAPAPRSGVGFTASAATL